MTTKLKKSTKLDPYSTVNMLLANEVQRLASNWVQTFNYIQIDVLELVAQKEGGSVSEYIRHDEITWSDIADHEGKAGDKKWIKAQQKEYPDIKDHPSYYEVEDQQLQDNYPMWNTCFEFKTNESETVLQAAIDAGIGVIEGLGDFNQILFFRGCGYSFYGQHWIPLFLNLPWNENLKEKYKNVNFQGV